jgi:oligopeptide/dipeptide ABC transporter ATP-binding protein
VENLNSDLTLKNLFTQFQIGNEIYPAVQDVSFELRQGQSLGLVGESGCGKSVTAKSILNLIQSPGRIVSGEVLYQKKNLLKLDPEDLRQIRGRKIAMVFQEPMTSLNPVFTCGEQVRNILKTHSQDSSKTKVLELFKELDMADEIFDSYPHQLSGGLRQRVLLAMALCCEPNILLADEPTTALDVTTQAEILDLIQRRQRKLGMSLLMITHDLGVVAKMCSQIAVMYSGRIVELGPASEIFKKPSHPYTQGLMNSVPPLHTDRTRLDSIPGTVPPLNRLPKGCAFQDRCDFRTNKCLERPSLIDVEPTVGTREAHKVACWNPL